MDTSLGLGTATTWGAAWDKGSSNHIRPYNGGRVVKWVASDGTIKTSVNMMPANAQNISTTASNEITTPSATNTTTTPNMSDDAVDHSLAEVAKTFHWREFGNGAANGGTEATYADASMLDAADDIVYVMDDGLTSLSGDDSRERVEALSPDGTGDTIYFTFLGTGLSITREDTATGNDEQDEFINGVQITDGSQAGNTAKRVENIVQNLPYGTHIYKFKAEAVDAYNRCIHELTIHQPKMPPIPEDAVVLADYMLMADFVAHTGGEELVSKGVRVVSVSRDHFFDCVSTTIALTMQESQPNGFKVVSSLAGSGDTATMRLPYFGTDFVVNCYNARAGTLTENLNSDVGTFSAINTSAHDGAAKHIGNNLGVNELKAHNAETLSYDDDFYVFSSEIVSPIHSSSHYQSFETPFLHELVGGDRNMEQTNLVVTPDGKTWHEVNRDVSYIGTVSFRTTTDTNHTWATHVVFDDHRGGHGSESYKLPMFNKDFAIAYNGMICLRDGEYVLKCNNPQNNDDVRTIVVNYGAGGGRISYTIDADARSYSATQSIMLFLNRGDRVGVRGSWKGSLEAEEGQFWAERIS